MRQDFLSIAGHELKTPLTSVLLNLRAVDKSLQGGARADDPRLAARWQALGRQIGRLEGLVDQLLDVSRITAGKMVLAPEPIDLGELVREVVGRFSPPSLRRRPAPSTCRRRRRSKGSWDRLRLEQILTNLLSNAVKYGAGRPISVEVGATGPGDGRGGLDRRPRSRHRHVRATSSGASSAASNAPSPSATTAASGWACGSCGRWSTPWAAASPSRASPSRGSTFTVRLPRRAAAVAAPRVIVHSPWDASSRRARPPCSSGGTRWRRPSPASARTSPSP